MAHIEAAPVALLTADTAIDALIDGRIHPSKLVQSEPFPAITYLRVSTPRIRSHSGPSGLAHARVQINCWAETWTGARDLADLVRMRLDGWKGVAGGVRIGGIQLDSERDDFDPDRSVQRVIHDYIVAAYETTLHSA